MSCLNDATIRCNENERTCSKVWDRIAYLWEKILQNQSTDSLYCKTGTGTAKKYGKELTGYGCPNTILQLLWPIMNTNENEHSVYTSVLMINRTYKERWDALCMLIEPITAHTNIRRSTVFGKVSGFAVSEVHSTAKQTLPATSPE